MHLSVTDRHRLWVNFVYWAHSEPLFRRYGTRRWTTRLRTAIIVADLVAKTEVREEDQVFVVKLSPAHLSFIVEADTIGVIF